MKKITMLLLVIAMFIMLGCQKEVSSQPFERLLGFKNSYVGNNTAVGGIINELPGAKSIEKFSLQTSEEPYGITVFYNKESDYWEEDKCKNMMMYNAAALFALVDNVDNVTFILNGDESDESHFLREEMEALIENDWSYYYESVEHWENGLYKQLYLEESTN